jgi:hypothetical protein
MTLYSAALITELKTFVAHRGSYAAVTGQTDDLVSAMLIVVRMLSVIQTFDAKISDSYTDHADMVVPMPFIMSVTF